MSTTLACPQCGAEPPVNSVSDASFCTQCGTALSAPPTAPAMTQSVPPPIPTMVPPTPLAVANPGVILPYGELQHAATYLGMVRTLRTIGIRNILVGAIIFISTIITALARHDTGSAAVIGMLLAIVSGVFSLTFIAGGIWLITKPSANGLLVAAIIMFVTAAIALATLRILWAVVLVFYGVALLKQHNKYGHLMIERPSEAMLKQAGELLDKLQKGARKKSPDLVEFSSTDMLYRRLWRGLLQDNLVVLIALERRRYTTTIADVYFLPPGAFTIETSRRELIGKWLKGTLYVNDQKMNGTVPPECYDRYLAWKQQYQMPV